MQERNGSSHWGRDSGVRSSSSEAAAGPAPSADARNYRVAAVIVHSSAPDRRTGRASTDNGHYTYVRELRHVAGGVRHAGANFQRGGGGGRWLEKNDARVRETTEADVLSHQRGCCARVQRSRPWQCHASLWPTPAAMPPARARPALPPSASTSSSSSRGTAAAAAGAVGTAAAAARRE